MIPWYTPNNQFGVDACHSRTKPVPYPRASHPAHAGTQRQLKKTTTAVGSLSGVAIPAISEPPPHRPGRECNPGPGGHRIYPLRRTEMTDPTLPGTSVPGTPSCTTPDTQNRRKSQPPVGANGEQTGPAIRVTPLATRMLIDNRLSLTARGLAVYIAAREDDRFTYEAIAAECGAQSLAEIEAAWQELEQFGYLEHEDEAGVQYFTDIPGYAPPPPPRLVRLPPPPKWVYFVERDGLIEIGHTGNLTKRLKALNRGQSMAQGMTVGPVKVLATEPGDRNHEQRLHERFARTRVGDTEWFRPTKELRAYIAALIATNGVSA